MNTYEFRAVRDVINTLHNDNDRLKLLVVLTTLYWGYDE